MESASYILVRWRWRAEQGTIVPWQGGIMVVAWVRRPTMPIPGQGAPEAQWEHALRTPTPEERDVYAVMND